MASNLSPQMKQLLKGENPSSVYPIVLLLKNANINNPSSWKNKQLGDFLLFSTKQEILSADEFLYIDHFRTIPLLKDFPKVTSKADIINHKHTISNLVFNIINSDYKGKSYSERITEFVNSICIVYYSANGIKELSQCYQAYTGTTRRFVQSDTNIQIQVEDLTQQKLTSLVPTSLQLSANMFTEDGEEEVAVPYPMVYGQVYKHKLTKSKDVNSNIHDLAKLVIDKPGKDILGVWTGGQSTQDYGNEFITENHSLITNGMLSANNYLLFGEDSKYNYVSQKLVNNFSYPLSDAPSDGNIYTYSPSTAEEPSHIKLGYASIEDENDEGETIQIQAIPNRIYRPIKRVGFKTHNDNNFGGDSETADRSTSYNYFFGYTDISAVGWKYYSHENSIAQKYLNEYIFNQDDQFFSGDNIWAPTKANYPIFGEAFVDEYNWLATGPYDGHSDIIYKDDNLQYTYTEEDKYLPVDWVQNDKQNSGIYMFSQITDGSSTGNSFAQFEFEDIPTQDCRTKLYTDWVFHSPANTGKSDGLPAWSRAVSWGAEFWNNGEGDFQQVHWSPEDSEHWKVESSANECVQGDCLAQTIANADHQNGEVFFKPDGYANSNPEGNEETIQAFGAVNNIGWWNSTSSVSFLRVGQPPNPDRWGSQTANDVAINMFELKNLYLLQDTYYEDITTKDFYADVAGRVGGLSQPIYDVEIIEQKLIGSIYEMHSINPDSQWNGRNVIDYVPDDYVQDINGDYPPLWINKVFINCTRNPYSDLVPYDELLGPTGGIGTYLYVETPLNNFAGPYRIIDRDENWEYSTEGQGADDYTLTWEVVYVLSAGKLDWNLALIGQSFISTFSSVTLVDEDPELIQKPHRIIQDILESELNFTSNYDYDSVLACDSITNNWKMGFSLQKQMPARELVEGISKESNIIPAFSNEGKLYYIPIYDVINDSVDVRTINSSHIKKYTFQYTNVDKICNSVNVKYRYIQANSEFTKETGYSLESQSGVVYENLDELTNSLGYSNPDQIYSLDYYNLSIEDGKLEYESKYIHDEATAIALQKRLLMFHCNQHLITKIELPMSYIDLEVGNIIRFNELFSGQKAFGFDYTKHNAKNGQLIYPFFFVTKIEKNVKGIKLEAIQLHRGQYGFPNNWEDFDTIEYGMDTGDIILPDGTEIHDWNQYQGDFNSGGWDDWEEDVIGDEEEIEDPNIERFFKFNWKGRILPLSNTQPRIEGIVTSNWSPSFVYEIWLTKITRTFSVRNPLGNEITYRAGDYTYGQIDGLELLDVSAEYNYNNSLADSQADQSIALGFGGSITISKKYSFPVGVYVEYKIIVKSDSQNPNATTLTTETENNYLLPYNYYRRTEDPTDIPFNDDFTPVPDYPFIESTTVIKTFNQIGDFLDNEEESDDGYITDIPDRGDINFDGVTNVLDVVILVNIILGYDSADNYEGNPDLNDDGILNVQDVINLVNEIIGN